MFWKARISIFAILLITLVFNNAFADVVYMRSGKKYVGEVSQKGNEYIIKMAYGTIKVKKSDVIFVAYGSGNTNKTTQSSRQTSIPASEKPIGLTQIRQTRWDFTKATLPEPIVFMLTRRLELLKELQDDSARQSLKQWIIAAHDKKRKVGNAWLTRQQQRRRRIIFETHLQKGNALLRQARSIVIRTPADRTKKKHLIQKAEHHFTIAVRAFPDDVIADFLTGILELRHKRYERAEMRFRRCCQAEPLVAAFHQGRALALMKLNRPLAALSEFMFVLKLRDDTFLSLEMLQNALKKTPGAKLSDPLYIKAKKLLERYQAPPKPNRYKRKGLTWLMPAEGWQSRSWTYTNPSHFPNRHTGIKLRIEIDERFSLMSPPYDRIIAKQGLAIPVSSNVLIVDKNAIADAKLIYIQISPEEIVQGKVIGQRYRISSNRKVPELPLGLITTSRANFVPVCLVEPSKMKTGADLTIYAVNLYRQMGSSIRTDSAKTGSITKAGKPKLDKALLPGEPLGAVFMGESLAGLFTGRTEVEAIGCGKSTFIPSADLDTWLKHHKYFLQRRRRYNYYRGPKLKEDIPIPTIKGKVFLVHILSTEKISLEESN